MFLLPSNILYTNCIDAASWTELSTEKYIVGVSQDLQNGGTYPKLQVVKKDGYYFTLNDTKLQLYRYLEKIGQCGRVEVERVSLREVPEGIRKLMIVPDTPLTSKVKSTKKNKGKYHSVDSSDKKQKGLLAQQDGGQDDDDDDYDDDDYISGSEVDSDEDSSEWSDEDPSATDIESSDENHGGKTEAQDETESFI